MSAVSETIEPTLDPAASTPVEPRDRTGIPALVAATAISSVGNGITALAIPWFVLVTTGSAARTGLVGALTMLAYVMSGFLGGALVDRLGYKRTCIVSDLLSGVTVALIPTLYLLNALEYWHILVLTFCGAVFDAPGRAARTALTPQLARRAGMSLERANAAKQLAIQVSDSLVAPLLAGLLIALMGAAKVLYVDATTFAVSMLIVWLFVRVPAGGRAVGQAANPRQKTSYMGEIAEGLRFVTQDAFLRVFIPISILFNFLFAPVFIVTMPVFVREEMGGAGILGLLAAGYGVGFGLSTLAYGARAHRVSRLRMFYLGVGVVAFACWILALATGFWMALLAMFVIGIAVGPVNILIAVIIQARVPEGILGRVAALNSALSSIAAPLGIFLFGLLVEVAGYRVALAAMAGGTTLTTIWVLAAPGLRRMRAELDGAAR